MGKKVVITYFWNLEKSDLLFALIHMAKDRKILRKLPGVSFIKMVGTGKGQTFTPTDADITRWGLIAVIDEDRSEELDQCAVIKSWRSRSTSEFRALLDPISSHGKWARINPFDFCQENLDGKVVAITRARIKMLSSLRFWSSVPPVTKSLHNSDGLITAFGIGEAPIGLQGTFSIWRDGAALRKFAYKGEEHAQAIKATERYRWYSEELFARFHLREVRGSLGQT